MTSSSAILDQRHSAYRRNWAVWLICSISACTAGAMQTAPDSSPAAHIRIRSAAKPPSQKAQSVANEVPSGESDSQPPQPVSPSDAAAGPPHVNLNGGTLTVEANNSDLSTILKDVAAASGMTIDGLNKSARVFGVYGPGTPRDVLTDLLSDTGYNFLMVGGANGTVPRELVLTAQNSNSLPPAASAPSAPSASDDANSDADYQEPLGPGAIAHPAPEPPDDPQARVQQRLQNLQMMRQQLNQQQQQDNPQ